MENRTSLLVGTPILLEHTVLVSSAFLTTRLAHFVPCSVGILLSSLLSTIFSVFFFLIHVHELVGALRGALLNNYDFTIISI
jgi:hypothetical protein